MLEKLRAVANRFEELCARSEQPDFYNDPKKAAAILRERNDLEPIVEAYEAYRRAEQDMADAQELMSDPDMKELCQQTYQDAKAAKEELYEKLQILLLPKDPNDDKSVIVEIRGAAAARSARRPAWRGAPWRSTAAPSRRADGRPHRAWRLGRA